MITWPADTMLPLGLVPWPVARLRALPRLPSQSGKLSVTVPVPAAMDSGPAAVGALLFRHYVLPFEVTSILLLVAMLGAIILTQKDKGGR